MAYDNAEINPLNLPVVPLLDGSPAFCRGFETGLIWHRLSMNYPVWDCPVHASNLPQLRLLADYFDADLRVGSENGEWAYVTMRRRDFFTRLLVVLHWLFW